MKKRFADTFLTVRTKYDWYNGDSGTHMINASQAPILVIHGEQDIRQAWLPFMHGCVMKEKPVVPDGWEKKPDGRYAPIVKAKIKSRKRKQRINDTPYKLKAEYKVLYHYEKDQFILPFHEHRRIVGSIEFDNVRYAGFPGWETVERKGRQVDVKPFNIRGPIKDVREWCVENLQDRFYVEGNSCRTNLYCAKYDDLVLARLRWK